MPPYFAADGLQYNASQAQLPRGHMATAGTPSDNFDYVLDSHIHHHDEHSKHSTIVLPCCSRDMSLVQLLTSTRCGTSHPVVAAQAFSAFPDGARKCSPYLEWAGTPRGTLWYTPGVATNPCKLPTPRGKGLCGVATAGSTPLGNACGSEHVEWPNEWLR